MPPDLETKLSIVKQKCQLNQITLPEEVMEYIAQHISDNIRQMEGAIIKISVNANLMNASIDLNLAKTVLERFAKDHAEAFKLGKYPTRCRAKPESQIQRNQSLFAPKKCRFGEEISRVFRQALYP